MAMSLANFSSSVTGKEPDLNAGYPMEVDDNDDECDQDRTLDGTLPMPTPFHVDPTSTSAPSGSRGVLVPLTNDPVAAPNPRSHTLDRPSSPYSLQYPTSRPVSPVNLKVEPQLKSPIRAPSPIPVPESISASSSLGCLRGPHTHITFSPSTLQHPSSTAPEAFQPAQEPCSAPRDVQVRDEQGIGAANTGDAVLSETYESRFAELERRVTTLEQGRPASSADRDIPMSDPPQSATDDEERLRAEEDSRLEQRRKREALARHEREMEEQKIEQDRSERRRKEKQRKEREERQRQERECLQLERERKLAEERQLAEERERERLKREAEKQERERKEREQQERLQREQEEREQRKLVEEQERERLRKEEEERERAEQEKHRQAAEEEHRAEEQRKQRELELEAERRRREELKRRKDPELQQQQQQAEPTQASASESPSSPPVSARVPKPTPTMKHNPMQTLLPTSPGASRVVSGVPSHTTPIDTSMQSQDLSSPSSTNSKTPLIHSHSASLVSTLTPTSDQKARQLQSEVVGGPQPSGGVASSGDRQRRAPALKQMTTQLPASHVSLHVPASTAEGPALTPTLNHETMQRPPDGHNAIIPVPSSIEEGAVPGSCKKVSVDVEVEMQPPSLPPSSQTPLLFASGSGGGRKRKCDVEQEQRNIKPRRPPGDRGIGDGDGHGGRDTAHRPPSPHPQSYTSVDFESRGGYSDNHPSYANNSTSSSSYPYPHQSRQPHASSLPTSHPQSQLPLPRPHVNDKNRPKNRNKHAGRNSRNAPAHMPSSSSPKSSIRKHQRDSKQSNHKLSKRGDAHAGKGKGRGGGGIKRQNQSQSQGSVQPLIDRIEQ
ncbi:hypothetical protein Moror_13028 [Moniliophthora roreri MCA 2997]|uniref:Uncharacterized protein n=2 Tax=Moniliophthora roreri TaxID=221103 RepID=V2XMW3_MONRO|nr:hypothetical protein Moror_13028 [Moniliophthora roreri MCA 2997]